jgi:hypothetical protein
VLFFSFLLLTPISLSFLFVDVCRAMMLVVVMREWEVLQTAFFFLVTYNPVLRFDQSRLKRRAKAEKGVQLS